MSIVGGFPGLNNTNRRTIRGPVNPLDVCTIVSIFPFAIREKKSTIQPGVFVIKAGTYDNPATLVVGSSSWWKEIDENQPLLEIPNSSIQVADSVVKDYCNGLLGCNMSDCMPGIFWVPGKLTVVDIKKNHQNLLDKAKVNQDNYWRNLVKMADSLWSRTNGNPLCIGEDMRVAARELEIHENKAWMKDFTLLNNRVNCKACGSQRNPEFPVCPTCGFAVEADVKNLGLIKVK